MDADVSAALSMSHLHELPPEVLDKLVTGAVRTKISAGSVTHREGEPAPHLELGDLRSRASLRDSSRRAHD